MSDDRTCLTCGKTFPGTFKWRCFDCDPERGDNAELMRSGFPNGLDDMADLD